jgi:SRSO17 transposase
LSYLSALLRLQTQRHFTNIAQVSEMSSQNIQHFMSNSPWDARFVLWKVQREIARTPALQEGGVLILDESADEKASAKTAGAAPQHNGRLGKVEMSQVGTFLAFAHLPTHTWTWVDGELFVPEACFLEDAAPERERVGIPKERVVATKIQLGWQMIQRVKAHGLAFEALACDDLYGRSHSFRALMHKAGILYMADVPANTRVAPTPFEHQADLIWNVSDIAHAKTTLFQQVEVRPTERGVLCEDFAAVRVFTWRDGQASEEWLVMRRFSDASLSYSLCNAPPDTPLSRLAWLKCVRHFVERANQDAKSEIGWDELQAQKYRAWEHHLALTILSTWFVAQTKLEWAQEYPADPTLLEQMQVDRLPALSLSNVRTMLRAVMPLPQLTPEQATQLVVKQLYNRTQSRKSRLKKRRKPPT